jgi:uncharacterized protein HemY
MISEQLKAGKMQLECLLCLAYIGFDEKDWKQAQTYFDKAYNVSVKISADFLDCEGDERDQHR